MATELMQDIAKVPSSIDIGLQASKKGNFQLAKQMLHNAIEQFDGQEDKQGRLIELIVSIADTHLNEGSYDQAKEWYQKALHRLENEHAINSLPAAAIMARLAELGVLQRDMKEFQMHFDTLQRSYLLAPEVELSGLINSLVDLSWVLCSQKCVAETQAINSLIAQMKLIEEEDKILGLRAVI